MGGTMQLEIADVLEPLYRAGEEWEKLHRIHEVQLGRLTDVGRAADAAAPPGRDRRAQAGRSGRGVRLVGRGGQGGSVVGAGARRAAAPGARHAPVGRLRHHDVRARRRPSTPPAVRRDVLLRLAASFENDLGDLERAENALRAGAAASTRRIRRRWRRSIASTRARGCTRTWRRSCASASTITDDSDELVDAEPAPRARLRRGARRGRSGDRQLPGGARARVALARRAGRPRAALLPQRALAGAVRHLREAGRRRQGRRAGMADCYARMAKLAADALDDRAKAVELWGRVVDIRGEDAIALSGLADLHEMAERVEGADRGPREAGRAPRRTPRRASRSTSAWAASGARSCRASATRSRAGRRSWRSIRRTSTPCARSPPTTRARAPGRSCRRRCAA